MYQFTKKWNWKQIVYHQGYIFTNLPTTNISSTPDYLHLQDWFLKFKWCCTKYKAKVPDVSNPNQNIEITCKCKLKFTELKRFIHQNGPEKLVKDEL